jgi:GT2 family glycosyltransferase
LLNRLRSDQQIAILGPRINESHYLDYSAGFQPNVTIEILNVIYIGRYLEALLIFLSSEARAGHCLEVGWVLGACMVVRSSVLDKLSGFDSDYFMFYEEVDLCRRALEYGYKVYYLNSVSVSHIGSVSVKRDYETFTRYFYSSKRLFIDKHFHGVTKCLMSSLLTAQSVTQLILWILLLPVYGDKSRKKISAHCELLTGKALIS